MTMSEQDANDLKFWRKVLNKTKEIMEGLTPVEKNEEATNEYFWNAHKEVWRTDGRKL